MLEIGKQNQNCFRSQLAASDLWVRPSFKRREFRWSIVCVSIRQSHFVSKSLYHEPYNVSCSFLNPPYATNENLRLSHRTSWRQTVSRRFSFAKFRVHNSLVTSRHTLLILNRSFKSKRDHSQNRRPSPWQLQSIAEWISVATGSTRRNTDEHIRAVGHDALSWWSPLCVAPFVSNELQSFIFFLFKHYD